MNSLFFKSLLISLFLVPIVKAGSGTKFDWVKDLKDVEHYHSDDYVDYKHNKGKEVFVPVYKSWPHWTNFLRSKAKREDKWSQKQSNYEEYEPSLFIKNEFEAFSKYLWDVSNLCGRLPTKKELILLSSGKPTPDLKCSEVPLLNGSPLSESKHWYETFSDPELFYSIEEKKYARVFYSNGDDQKGQLIELPQKFSKNRNLSKEQQLDKLINKNGITEKPYKVEYFDLENLVMTFKAPPLIWDEKSPFYSPISYYYVFKGTHSTNGNNNSLNIRKGYVRQIINSLCSADKLVLILKGEKLKKDIDCYHNDQIIFPYQKYLSKKNLKKDEEGNYKYNFKSLKTDPNPSLYFKEVFNKMHGKPKPPKKKDHKDVHFKVY